MKETMKVKAAVFESVGKPLVVEDLDMIAEPGPGKVLVRYRASGLCHSDLSNMRNPAQVSEVLGHEGAGTIEAVGPGVDDLRVGDTVIASFRGSCGVCFHCLRGENPHCEWGGGAARTVLREPRFHRPDGRPVAAGLGTFGEAAILPTQFVVKVDTVLSFAQLALLGCGVTTGFCAAVNTAGVTLGSSVVVLGCGGVGQSAIQGAKIAGATRIIAIDNVQSKLDFALAHGATDAFLAEPGADPVAFVRDLTQGRGADFVLEMTGLADLLSKGYEMLRRRGVLVGVGLHADAFTIPIQDLILNEKQIRGSLYGSARTPLDFPRLVRYAELGELDLESMVSDVIGLDDINEGLDAIERGGVIRTVVTYP